MAASTASAMATASPRNSMNPTSTEHDFRFPRRPPQDLKREKDAAAADETASSFIKTSNSSPAAPSPPQARTSKTTKPNPTSAAIKTATSTPSPGASTGGTRQNERMALHDDLDTVMTTAPLPSDTLAATAAGDLGSSLRDLKLDLTATAPDDLLATSLFPALEDGHKSPEDMARDDPLATQVWKFFSKTKQLLPNQQRMENLTWRMMHSQLRKKREGDESRYEICHFFPLRRPKSDVALPALP